MKRNCSASVWLLLALVVVLFWLSALAPREWSHWDSRPLQPSESRLARLQLAAEPQSRQPVATAPPRLATPAEPNLAETEPEAAYPETPKPDLEPLPTKTILAEDAFSSPPVAQSITPRGLRTLEAALSREKATPAVGYAVDRRGRAMPGDEIEPGSPASSVSYNAQGPSVSSSAGNPPGTRLEQRPDRLEASPALRQTLSASTGLLPHWPYPTELAGRLHALTENAPCASWCEAVLRRLERLSSFESLAATEVGILIPALRRLAEEGLQRANTTPKQAVRSEWTRTAWGLKRRLDIWEQVYAIASSSPPAAATVQDSRGLRQAYDKLAARLLTDANGESWRRYLLMSEAQGQFFGHPASDTVASRNLAKRILLRTDYSVLAPKQQTFLQESVCAEYLRQLRHLATEPVDYLRLLNELERYEHERLPEAALHVAAAQQILRWADAPAIAELGRRIDVNYRNANLRVTLSRSFLERMLPPPEPVAERVDEIIQGAYTTGCSETLTELGVCLLPSSDCWRIGLMAKGQVATETQSNAGAATFFSRGSANFLAAKEVVIHRFGWYHRAAVADAESSNKLSEVTTRLDPVPLLGDLARAIAIERYRSETPAAERQVRDRVTATASDRIDAEVSCRLNQLQKRFHEHFYVPLQQLALNPLAVDMHSTEACLAGRYRLAGHDQLAAHTPRDLAPAGSLFQLQVHESALNNLFQQLKWEGRRVNVRQLDREIAAHFKLADERLPEEMPDDVFVKFADETPVRVDFQEGRVRLQLALAELSQGGNRWRNFTVRVYYRRTPDQLGAQLVRDQYVELIGKRLHLREQIALRGIFSRVFAQNQPIELVGDRLQTDSRLAGLGVDQFEIRDGWLSVSLGPPAEEPVRTAREPSNLHSSDRRNSRPANGPDGQRAIMIRLRLP